MQDLSAAASQVPVGFAFNTAEPSAAQIDTFAQVTTGLPEMLHDPAIVVDPRSGVMIAANRCACETYCGTGDPDGLIGRNITELWTDPDSERAFFDRVISTGYSVGLDTVRRGITDPAIIVRSNASKVIFDRKPAILYIDLDIGDRKVTQRQITRANIEWRETVDSVPDLIVLEDLHGNIRRCNRAAIELFGGEYTQAIGRPLASLLAAADNSGSDHLRSKVWEGRIRGREGWFEIRNNRVRSDHSGGNVWVHIVKDITSARKAKLDLLKLNSVIEQSSDGKIVVDATGMIEYLNQMAERTFNTASDSVIGCSIFDLKPEISKELFLGTILPFLDHHKFWRDTYTMTRGDDTIFEEITVTSILDIDGKKFKYAINLRDVTETHQLQSIGEAVSLMENFGYVFSAIRHELGNPVNSVKMALTVLRKNFHEWDRERSDVFISRCLAELGRVEYLLKTLRNFSLHENLEITEIDLNEFYRRSFSYAAADFENRGIAVRYDITDSLAVFGDARALHQVMINLLTNAADALDETPAPHITVRVRRSRSWTHISVEDNGRGMSPKQMESLFKPFYTSKPGDTGIGLVIVQKMVANMGSTIDIESSPGTGTRVTVALKTVS